MMLEIRFKSSGSLTAIALTINRLPSTPTTKISRPAWIVPWRLKARTCTPPGSLIHPGCSTSSLAAEVALSPIKRVRLRFGSFLRVISDVSSIVVKDCTRCTFHVQPAYGLANNKCNMIYYSRINHSGEFEARVGLLFCPLFCLGRLPAWRR